MGPKLSCGTCGDRLTVAPSRAWRDSPDRSAQGSGPANCQYHSIPQPAWRRERDSNPRYALTHTRFPGVHLKPLGHLSNRPAHVLQTRSIARQRAQWRRGWDSNPRASSRRQDAFEAPPLRPLRYLSMPHPASFNLHHRRRRPLARPVGCEKNPGPGLRLHRPGPRR